MHQPTCAADVYLSSHHALKRMKTISAGWVLLATAEDVKEDRIRKKQITDDDRNNNDLVRVMVEKYDLKAQLSRSCKAIPRLIAEGYANRHQQMGFQKYLDRSMAECNETIVSPSRTRDLYAHSADVRLCGSLIDIYDKSSRQLHNLDAAWNKFKKG
jgi:four helix bundle protein